jgi:hypothetical protein
MARSTVLILRRSVRAFGAPKSSSDRQFGAQSMIRLRRRFNGEGAVPMVKPSY